MIIGISGKKQSGKGVLSQWLINKSQENGYQAKVYSFASFLKRFAVDVMCLEEKQVYGTDDDKNTLTKYKWENMPFYEHIVWEHAMRLSKANPKKSFKTIWKEAEIFVPKGYMKAREVMQTLGTEIGRRMYSEIWVEALMNLMKKESKDYPLQIVDDVRFVNEADAIKNIEEGLLVRLTRKISDDNHLSETALDNYEKFNRIIDNQNMTKDEFIKYLDDEFDALDKKYLDLE